MLPLILEGGHNDENTRLLLNDSLAYTEEKNPGMLLMIDIGKAFDSVSWSFTAKKSRLLSFWPRLKKMDTDVLQEYQLCVSLNGHYTQWLGVYRRVAQGDPCSLYLYLRRGPVFHD